MASSASPADGEDEDEEEMRMRLQARVAALQCLAPGEAAKMIEGMQVNEASRLVMAMPAEQRCAALVEVDDNHRAAVIAAMPAETAVVVMNELSKAVPEEEASSPPEVDSDKDGVGSSSANTAEGCNSAAEVEKAVVTEKEDFVSESMESCSVSTTHAAAEPPPQEAASASEAATMERSAGKEVEETSREEAEEVVAAGEAARVEPEEVKGEADKEADQGHPWMDTGLEFSPPPRIVGEAATSESQDEGPQNFASEPPVHTEPRTEPEAETDEVVLESLAPISNHHNRPRAVVREGSCMDSLSTQEAAQVLATVPPFEAARLALSMDDEERMQALACMPDKARKAVLEALPYDFRLATGFMDADLEDELLEYKSDSDEDADTAEERGPRLDFDSDTPSSSASSKSRVGVLSQRAMGAAGTAAGQMRNGLEKAAGLAAERARTSEVPAKVVMYGGKAKDAASSAAGMARQGLGRAAEKAKSSELGGRASDLSGKAKEAGNKAAATAAHQATEAKLKAKELGAAAADTAKAKLSSASKSIAGFMRKKSR